ncbi:hypothetical protein BPAE_0018g00180 [Botrytis paeoniae]|uniref:Ribosomal protein L22e n=1 Tax=Botrytis paeoniae TaxID=278948 RepID=A0A4Z1G1A1_9HELO|nr:hypothetical protein BPAE_0018g00180 [Botrytis paeoniae]
MPAKAGNKKGPVVKRKFTINCTQPAEDKIFDTAAFEKFLQDNLKVDGLKSNLGDKVTIVKEGELIKIETSVNSGHYLKYLTKKFLKKNQLRDWLRVVSTSKGVYSLRFFNVVGDDAEEDDE